MTVTGNDVELGEGQRVRDLVVMGGRAEVRVEKGRVPIVCATELTEKVACHWITSRRKPATSTAPIGSPHRKPRPRGSTTAERTASRM